MKVEQIEQGKKLVDEILTIENSIKQFTEHPSNIQVTCYGYGSVLSETEKEVIFTLVLNFMTKRLEQKKKELEAL